MIFCDFVSEVDGILIGGSDADVLEFASSTNTETDALVTVVRTIR